MRHGSLFSGIGGFDLAAEWMGWENVFHCEFNPFCQKILKHYWPDAKRYGDIKETDFTEWKGRVDIVSGGFPCQPYSQAGKRKGKADDRHLWPEMLRAIREIRPSWIVGENVPGLLNWERGVVLDEIKADLEAAGFEVFPPLVLPACGKNAPHRRERLWIVAHSSKERGARLPTHEANRFCSTNGGEYSKILQTNQNGTYESGIITDTDSNQRSKGRMYQAECKKTERHISTFNSRFIRRDWKDFPTVSPIRGRDDGLSSKLVKQCLEALGNAIVPQVAYEIFKAIEQVNN